MRTILSMLLLGSVGAVGQTTVLGVEVTQSIQAIDNSVPLVGGKATLVRAYVKSTAANLNVVGRLAVASGNNSTWIAAGPTAVTSNANLEDLRSNTDNSLNFLLSPAWSTGQITLRTLEIRDSQGAQLSCTGCDLNKTFTFEQVPPLRIKLIGVTYRVPGSNVVATPRDLDFAIVESWLRRAYPIPRLISTRTVLDASDLGLSVGNLECHNVNIVLSKIRADEVRSGVDPRTHYYALVPDDGTFMEGCSSGIPQTPDSSVVASGPSGIPSAVYGSWDSSEGSYAGFYAGHELAHTFGRYHPGFCRHQSSDDGSYPFDNGLLTGVDPRSGVDLHYTGLDFGARGIPVALPGPKWTDVMTYCDYEWPSHYTYTAIMGRLQAEGASASGAPSTQQLPFRKEAANGISIIASLNLTKKTGEFRFVSRVPESPTPPYTRLPELSRSELLADIEAVNNSGTILFTYPVRARIETDIPKEKDQTALINAVIPDAKEIMKLRLVLDGQRVGETAVDTAEQGAHLAALSTTQLNKENSQQFVAFLENITEEETNEGLLIRWSDTSTGSSYSIQIGPQDAPLETLALAIKKKYYVVKKSVLSKYHGKKVRVVVSSNNLSRSDAVSKIVFVK